MRQTGAGRQVVVFSVNNLFDAYIFLTTETIVSLCSTMEQYNRNKTLYKTKSKVHKTYRGKLYKTNRESISGSAEERRRRQRDSSCTTDRHSIFYSDMTNRIATFE